MSKLVPITSIDVGQEFRGQFQMPVFIRQEDDARWPELVQVINTETGKKDVFGKGATVLIIENKL